MGRHEIDGNSFVDDSARAERIIPVNPFEAINSDGGHAPSPPPKKKREKGNKLL